MKAFSIFVVCLLACFVFAEELHIEKIKENECDKTAQNGDMLTLHYTGSLASDNTKFDSSLDRFQPFTFQLGIGQVIKGWDEGLIGMCPGDHWILTVPPHLGYGSTGAGEVIPPDATLVFDVELIDIGESQPVVNVFKQIDGDDDDHLSKEEIISYIEMNVPTEAMGAYQTPETITEEVFRNVDKDGDGLISHDEFTGAKHDEF